MTASDPNGSRRSFLSLLGAPAVAGLATAALWPRHAAAASPSERTQVSRGLAHASDFLFEPGLIYLQTGSLGPTPRPIVEATMRAWLTLESNPLTQGYKLARPKLEAVRAKAAAFVGCKTDEIVITTGTTHGMNSIAQGLQLSAGDRVLTTDQEHPGGRSCWDYIARKNGVIIDTVVIPPGENDAQAIVDRFAKAIQPATKVLSFSHLLTSTGLRMPVAEICALARARHCIAVVDGAQAVGGVDVDVKALGCHAYATSCHKWLLAPKGTGFLYLSEELGNAIDPISLQAGREVYSDSSGVCNIPGVLGLGAAIDYVSAIGKQKIERHNLALRNQLYAALAGVPMVSIVSAAPGPLASPLLTFRLPDGVPSRTFQEKLLDTYKIAVKVVPSQWLNGTRLSLHLFNTEEDVSALVEALRKELTPAAHS
jgi:selenocysteine lyase/cysteine desulfurase